MAGEGMSDDAVAGIVVLAISAGMFLPFVIVGFAILRRNKK